MGSEWLPYEIVGKEGGILIKAFWIFPYIKAPLISPDTQYQAVSLPYAGQAFVEKQGDSYAVRRPDGEDFGMVTFVADRLCRFETNKGFSIQADIPHAGMRDTVFTGMIQLGAALATGG
jgi:hypothetical protein